MSVKPDFSTRSFRLRKLLEQLFEQSEWNQTTLAREIGVSRPTIIRWLQGKNLPDPGTNNFRELARSSGGSSQTLELYLDGVISLEEYRLFTVTGVIEGIDSDVSHTTSELPLAEILTMIAKLKPQDIADVISSSAALLVHTQNKTSSERVLPSRELAQRNMS